MKKMIGIIFALFTVAVIGAEEKLWLTDFDKAQKLAQKEGKLMFLDFTGSDWCPPCKIVKKEILSTEKFEKFAKENLVLVQVDFPRRTKQSAELKKANEALARKFSIRAFPTLIVLNKEGKELDRTVGIPPVGADQYIAKLGELKKQLLPSSI